MEVVFSTHTNTNFSIHTKFLPIIGFGILFSLFKTIYFKKGKKILCHIAMTMHCSIFIAAFEGEVAGGLLNPIPIGLGHVTLI